MLTLIHDYMLNKAFPVKRSEIVKLALANAVPYYRRHRGLQENNIVSLKADNGCVIPLNLLVLMSGNDCLLSEAF